jgi:HSP20 family protein
MMCSLQQTTQKEENDMSNITVQKVTKPEVASTLFESMNSLFADIRERAYEMFQQRGALHGGHLDDWFRAERDLVWAPESELVETDKEFRIKVAVPTMQAQEIQISALPDSIVIQGETSRKEEAREGKVHFSEFHERKLFRRFGLPEGIDVEQVKATLDKGVLQVVAAKTPATKEKKIAVAAA